VISDLKREEGGTCNGLVLYEKSGVCAAESNLEREWDFGSDQRSYFVKDVDIVCVPGRFDPFNLIFRFSKVTLDAQRDRVPPLGSEFPEST